MTTADTTTVRSWARENGFTTGDRGRLSQNILTAYAKASGSAPSGRTAKPAKTTAKTTAKSNVAAVPAPPKGPRKPPRAKAEAPATSKATGPAKASPAKKAVTTTSKLQPIEPLVTATDSTSAKPTRVPVRKPVATSKAAAGKAPASKAPARRAKKGPVSRPAARPRTVPAASPVATVPAEATVAVPVEVVTPNRVAALEKQVADLASRLVALEQAQPTSAGTDGAPAAKASRKLLHRK